MNAAQAVAYFVIEAIGVLVIATVALAVAVAAVNAVIGWRRSSHSIRPPAVPYISCVHGPGMTRAVRPSRTTASTGEGVPGTAERSAQHRGPTALGRHPGRAVPDTYFNDPDWAVA